MPPQAHAKLPASSSSRWMHCTPSAELESKYPESTSIFADEGSAAHEQGEYKIRKYLHQRMKKPASEYDGDEMDRYTDVYAQYVIDCIEEAKKTCEAPFVLVEQRLDLGNYIPGGFGTGDLILISDDTLQIIDLKYGKGVPVEADHNSQLMLYGLGALDAYGWMYDVKQVKLTIAQVRLDNIDSFTISVDELRKWGEEEVKPKALMASRGEGTTVAGPWCRFCRAKPHCRACAEQALSLAREEFADLDEEEPVTETKIGPIPKVQFKSPQTIDHDEIEAILPILSQISRWIEDVFSYVSDEAINHGAHWDGYKIVEGRSIRKYVDERRVEQAAFAAGYTDIYNKTLAPITQLEKAWGKKEFARVLGDLVIKPRGKLTLVPVTDKRPEVDLTTAEEEFTALD